MNSISRKIQLNQIKQTHNMQIDLSNNVFLLIVFRLMKNPTLEKQRVKSIKSRWTVLYDRFIVYSIIACNICTHAAIFVFH